MKKIKCCECQKLFFENELTRFDSGMWCAECLDEHTATCADCGCRIYRADATYTADECLICDRCYDDNYFYCERCDRVYYNEHRINDVCEWCYEYEDDEAPQMIPNDKRYYSKSRRDLPMGVEIEAESGDYLQVYDELTPKGFGVEKDGSLSNGIEVQVPASNNGNTEKLVKEACLALKNTASGFRSAAACMFILSFPAERRLLRNYC